MSFPHKFANYRVLEHIGDGTFSRVMLVEDQTGAKFAAKVVNDQEIEKRGIQESFKREIDIMQTLNHPNIVYSKEVINVPGFTVIIMEYCEGGSLLNYIISKNHLTERETLFIAQQVLKGIEYLHSKGIAHRDLKPENIVFDSNMTPKIIDFGFSTTVENKNKLNSTRCGSLAFVAPEVFTSFAYDAKRADIWSLGIVIFVMAAGYYPWSVCKDQKAVLKQIYTWDCVIPDFFPKQIKRLLNKMLVKEAQNRDTASDLLKNEVLWAKINTSSMGDIEIRRGTNYSFKPTIMRHEPFFKKRTLVRPAVRRIRVRMLPCDTA